VGEDVEALKRRVPLLDYLQQHSWIGWPAGRGEYVGLCPLHEETRPSFYVNTRKDVFYCHGCGEGGDLLRFLQLSRRVSFRQRLDCLDPETGAEPDSTALLEQTAAFYQQQLNNYPEALGYLRQRGLHDPALIRELGIGHAPGGNLRRYLTMRGYSFALLRRAGLINGQGTDALYQRIVFPLRHDQHIVNLYGRSRGAAFPHRFLPGSKGGLYAWEKVRHCSEIILVEGLFDYAMLRQAGFSNVTCSLGTHLNHHQFRQAVRSQANRLYHLRRGSEPGWPASRSTTGLSSGRARHHFSPRLSAIGSRSQLLLPGGRGCTRLPISAGGGTVMKFRVIREKTASGAHSPIYVIEQNTGQGVGWINRYLNREYVRRLANTTLYIYAHSLLHFVRWWESAHHTGDLLPAELTPSTLLDYVRFQSSQHPPPSASTINDRVACADRAIRNEFPDAPCQAAHGFHQAYLHRRPLGLGRPRFELSRLRVKEPRLTIVPLSVEEVARFWASFRTARDLAIVGLLLLHGLRSAEVMALNCEDVLLSEGQLRVRGKGNKLRFLPLAPETTQLLDHYLRLERPDPCSAALFVVLKGPARGQRITPAGLRSLFRHHRRITGIHMANPHRFRHTFATDMVRAGISLPALMQLMGHADIETTMRYVQVSPQDVYLQYARAAAQRIHPQPRVSS
jgi:integrase